MADEVLFASTTFNLNSAVAAGGRSVFMSDLRRSEGEESRSSKRQESDAYRESILLQSAQQ